MLRQMYKTIAESSDGLI